MWTTRRELNGKLDALAQKLAGLKEEADACKQEADAYEAQLSSAEARITVLNRRVLGLVVALREAVDCVVYRGGRPKGDEIERWSDVLETTEKRN